MILFILQETANSAGAEENIFLSTAVFYRNINFVSILRNQRKIKNYQELQFAKPFSVNVSFLKKA